MNTEIEIKILLTPQIKKLLTSKLLKDFKKEKKIHHVEYYLNNPSSSFFFTSKEGYKDAYDYLRIRKTEKSDSVCFKHWIRDEKTGKTTHCEEYETKVDNGEVLFELFKNLGYKDITIIDKTRTIYSSPNFEISVDTVKVLGEFLEIEVKKKVKDVPEGLNMIYGLLKDLGITQIIRMDRGYVSMLWNPKYDFGEKITL